LRERLTFRVFIYLYALILFPIFGLSEVFQVSEAREGFVIHEILSSGEWILPLRNGEFVPSKPPLFHWLGAALIKIFNGSASSEFFLRLPSFLASIALLFVVGSYAKKAATESAAILSVCFLSSMYGFGRLAGDGRVDMLFTLFTIWACLTGFEIIKAGSPVAQKIILKFSLLVALSVLAKGPLGFALPLLTLGTGWAAIHGIRSLRGLLRWQFIIGPLLAFPWYLAAYLRGESAFVERQIFFENIQRFFGGEGVNEKTSIFYLPHLIGQGAPWSILFFLYLFFLARETYRRRGKFTNNNLLPREAKLETLLNLLMFGVVLVILTASAGKRRGYLLLTLPSMALVLALRFSSTYERLKREGKLIPILTRFRYQTLSWGILIWILAIFPGLIPIFVDSRDATILDSVTPRASEFFSNLDAAIIRGGDIYPALYFGISLSSLGLWLYGHKKRSLPIASSAALLVAYLLTIFYIQVWLTMKGYSHTYKRLALRIATTVPSEVPLTIVKTRADESFDGLFFYLKRHMTILDPSKQISERGLYLARQEWLKTQNETSSEIFFSGGRRVDKKGKELVLFEVR